MGYASLQEEDRASPIVSRERPRQQQDVGVVHQALDQGDDTSGIGEDLAPIGDRDHL